MSSSGKTVYHFSTQLNKFLNPSEEDMMSNRHFQIVTLYHILFNQITRSQITLLTVRNH